MNREKQYDDSTIILLLRSECFDSWFSLYSMRKTWVTEQHNLMSCVLVSLILDSQAESMYMICSVRISQRQKSYKTFFISHNKLHDHIHIKCKLLILSSSSTVSENSKSMIIKSIIKLKNYLNTASENDITLQSNFM